ncbi:hypothetical protein KY343_02465 [Candidatus Woesearchaeota archaeon]|nr:hypothetical protein [Candidatus Woesearchaeota archaeon]
MAINETATVFGSILEFMTRVTGTLKVLVGGIFGLYVIMLIVKWIEYKKLVRILVGIRKEMRELNTYLGIKNKKKVDLISIIRKRTLQKKKDLKKKR